MTRQRVKKVSRRPRSISVCQRLGFCW